MQTATSFVTGEETACSVSHTRDGIGSPGQRFWPGRVGSWVSVSDPAFDSVLSFNMRVYRGVVSIEQHHLGKLISAVSVLVRFPSQQYWFTYFSKLVPVIFTYLRADCPCDVTRFLELTSFRLLTGSGRVGSPGQKLSGRVKNPDPVPSLSHTIGHLRSSEGLLILVTRGAICFNRTTCLQYNLRLYHNLSKITFKYV